RAAEIGLAVEIARGVGDQAGGRLVPVSAFLLHAKGIEHRFGAVGRELENGAAAAASAFGMPAPAALGRDAVKIAVECQEIVARIGAVLVIEGMFRRQAAVLEDGINI